MLDAIIREFVAEQRELLDLELQAETAEESSVVNNNNNDDERKSNVLGNLEASDVSVGLYGRTVVQLSVWENPTETLLPAHRFTVGDEVEIRTKHTKKSKGGFPGGVISAVSDTYVAVALFGGNKGKASTTKNTTKSNNNNKTQKDKQDGDDDDEDALGAPPLSLLPKSSVEVNKKLVHALQDLERDGVNHPIAGPVIQSMFQVQEMPEHNNNNNNNNSQQQHPMQPFNTNLDSSQLEAIRFALRDDRKIALIHGPPGTGKTTTIAELIHQAVHVKKMKVLCTAPSNVAVDNILERLVENNNNNNNNNKNSKKQHPRKNNNNNKHQNPPSPPLRAVRLGHPARIKSSILSYSLEALVQNADGTEIVADVRDELQSFLRILANPKSRPNDKRIAYREMKSLRKEVRTREEKVVQELLSSAQVVLATTVGAANRILRNHAAAAAGGGEQHGFDLVVIDEAAQALEASCWIPILRGKKVVLAGDHCQLPPTIKSNHPRAQQGLSRTMFERLMDLYGDNNNNHNKNSSTPPKISRMLQVQYRMHQKIADWASKEMYHGELKTHDSVKCRKLADLDAVMKITEASGSPGEFAETTLLLVDTAGCTMHETVNAAGSRFNEGEAKVVTQHVKTLLEMGLHQKQLAIITPYNGQVELLRSMLLPEYPNLEIRSVDGFQGGERDAVVLSLVRSSPRGGENGIGFLKDDRRHNVAVTRAKRHLAIVCDSETVSQSKFVESLIAWTGEHGEERSAVEYLSSAAAAGGSSSDALLYEQDMQMAEAELIKMVESTFAEDTKKKKVADTAVATTETKQDEERRKELMNKISAFAENGTSGDELPLASELTSYDRRLVHEFAEQIGLGHRSEGVDGVDRRLVLTIQEGGPIANNPHVTVVDKELEKEEEPEAPAGKITPSFAALAIDDSNSDDSESDAQPDETVSSSAAESQGVPANSLLGQLAAERAERQKQSAAKSAASGPSISSSSSKKKNNKKGKGQKLGGAKKVVAPAKQKEENYDDLDDMAFLDAQIEKSQNSHGRKVVGSGKSYRTIVNGILNERPKPAGPVKNARAGAALQSKLKEAQSARTKKTKKKKK